MAEIPANLLKIGHFYKIRTRKLGGMIRFVSRRILIQRSMRNKTSLKNSDLQDLWVIRHPLLPESRVLLPSYWNPE